MKIRKEITIKKINEIIDKSIFKLCKDLAEEETSGMGILQAMLIGQALQVLIVENIKKECEE